MERAILEVLASTAVRALCLAAVAGLVAWRIRRVTLRHAVWTLVLGGMLLLPVVSSIVPRMTAPEVVRRTAPVEMVVSHIPPPPTTARIVMRGPVTEAVPASNPGYPWWTILFAAYGSIALIFLVRLLLAYRSMRALVERSKVVRTPVSDQIAVSHSIGWPLPEVRESAEIRVPMAFGYRNPVILLPANWSGWDESKLRAVLAHELAHVRRRDWAITAATAFNRCLFWFHPLAWWLERKLAALAEAAADAASVCVTGDAERYAEVLLEMAANVSEGKRFAVPGVAMVRRSNIRKRIDGILAASDVGTGVLGRAGWAAVLACAVPLLYGAAAMQLTAPPLMSTNASEPDPEQVMLWESLSPEEVAAAEQRLEANPNDLRTRYQLLSYYLLQAMREPYLEQMLWLIEHEPQSDVHISYLNRLYPIPYITVGGGADYDAGLELWRKKAEEYPRIPRVLRNAGSYIGLSDPLTGEDLLQRARELDPVDQETTQVLVTLYRTAISNDIRPPKIGFGPPDPAFLIRTQRFLLEETNDASFPGTVAQLLGRSYFNADTPEGQAAEKRKAEYYGLLMARARELEPDNPAWKEPLPEPRPRPVRNQARPPSPPPVVPNPRVLFEVPPNHPPLVGENISPAPVVLMVRIGTDGRVTDIEAVSGDPRLVAAASEAVEQWIFEASSINGEPAEVRTEITIPF